MAFVSKREHLRIITNPIPTLTRVAKEWRLILYLSILVSVIPISEASSTCNVNGIYYLCNNIASKTDFPLVLPTNVQKVKLLGTNELDQSFPETRLNHQTWANVSELFILEFTNADHIGSGVLYGLKELKYLSISSCADLDDIDPDIFHSTPNTEALHLDGNTRLKLYTVTAALINKLDNLKYMSLIGIQASEDHVVLGDNFSKALHKKNLTYLDISGVNIIYVDHVIGQDLLANLKYFNLTYSTIVSPRGINYRYYSLIKNIELLDLTFTQYSTWKYYTIEAETLVKDADIKHAMYLFVQGMYNPSTPIRWNTRYSFENWDFNFPKMLDLGKNSIQLLNIALETVDLASSKMEFVPPNSLSNFPSLKILDLSNNLLNNMQDMDDFSSMFSHNKEHTDFRFVVFLSYCSQDSQIVDENILPSLNRYLHEKFNTERDLVCTGADSFVPGMRIIEEIHRCINESLVVVSVITPALLQSHWSQEQCVAAVDRHRQVVILMQQHTDTTRASVTIQNLIGQYTRGTWSNNKGHFVIRPAWNTICEGIIRGASESFRQYRRQHLFTPTEELPLV